MIHNIKCTRIVRVYLSKGRFFSHTDLKDFKDGYAASQLHIPQHAILRLHILQHHRVIGEAEILKIFRIRVRKISIYALSYASLISSMLMSSSFICLTNSGSTVLRKAVRRVVLMCLCASSATK